MLKKYANKFIYEGKVYYYCDATRSFYNENYDRLIKNKETDEVVFFYRKNNKMRTYREFNIQEANIYLDTIQGVSSWYIEKVCYFYISKYKDINWFMKKILPMYVKSLIDNDKGVLVEKICNKQDIDKYMTLYLGLVLGNYFCEKKDFEKAKEYLYKIWSITGDTYYKEVFNLLKRIKGRY